MNNSANSSNYYSSLDLDDASSNVVPDSVHDQPTKKPRAAPVVIQNLSRREVTCLLSSINIKSYKLKLMSIGVKVLFEESSDRTNFITLIKGKCIGFFTYASKESRPLKFIISGLDLYSTAEVHNELLANSIPCYDVKQIKIKNARFNAQTNYLIYIKKGLIKFADLKKCNSLFNTIIYWSPWRRHKHAVTQCYRCQMFGHGEDHCGLPPNCQKCSGKHSTAACNVSQLKCANCGGTHMASDPECSKRREYVEILSRVQQRSRKYRDLKHVHELNIAGANLPPLQRNSRQPDATNFSGNASTFRCSAGSYADAVRNGELFSSAEITAITRDLLSSLRSARTKEDQIMAVADVVTKYLYND